VDLMSREEIKLSIFSVFYAAEIKHRSPLQFDSVFFLGGGQSRYSFPCHSRRMLLKCLFYKSIAAYFVLPYDMEGFEPENLVLQADEMTAVPRRQAKKCLSFVYMLSNDSLSNTLYVHNWQEAVRPGANPSFF
jgi:hypothetical protein